MAKKEFIYRVNTILDGSLGMGDYLREDPCKRLVEVPRGSLVEFRIRRSTELDRSAWQRFKGQMRELDRSAYGAYGMILDGGRSTSWLLANPDIYTVLTDIDDRVYGYLNAMPITGAAFDAIMAGKRDDNSVMASDIVAYEDGRAIDLYLMSINIHPDSRLSGGSTNKSGLYFLLLGLVSHLEELAVDRGIRVRRVGAVAWTDEGRRLCELFGLRAVAAGGAGYQTFCLNLDGQLPDGTHKMIRRLHELYRWL